MIGLRHVFVPILAAGLVLATSAIEAQTVLPTATFVKSVGGAPRSSSPWFLTNVDGIVYFGANTYPYGNELWRTDGTTQGTVLVKDIVPGRGSSVPTNFTEINGTVLFVATDPTAGYELWKTNGTAAGTLRVKDIAPGPTGSAPTELTAIGDTLYFRADDGVTGIELWKSDGTEAGTVRVKDIFPGGDYSSPHEFTPVGALLFFMARTPAGNELWRSDGTEEGTVRLLEAAPATIQRYLTAVNDALFFVVATSGGSGGRLWKSDGTPQGTTAVPVSWPSGITREVLRLRTVGSTLFFTTKTPGDLYELWKTDGSSAGTVLVAETAPYEMFDHAGVLFFFTSTPGGIFSLWKTDGTPGGTTRIKEGLIEPRAIFRADNLLYFGGMSSTHAELWRSDGTELGTALVKQIGPLSGGMFPHGFVSLNGRVLFAAGDGINGTELWKSDGTAAGTMMLADIDPLESARVRAFTPANGKTFFATRIRCSPEVVCLEELWQTDGTSAGTARVTDVMLETPRPWYAGDPHSLANLNGTILFGGMDETGTELWKTDGSSAGTMRVKDVLPGSDSSGPRSSRPAELTTLNNAVFFVAHDGSNDQLWKTDGTSAGTVPLTVIDPASSDDHIKGLTIANGQLFFIRGSGISAGRVWKSDGTPAGTTFVSNTHLTDRLTVVGNMLYFTQGKSLFKSDGTAAGTSLVTTISGSVTISRLLDLIDVNGTLFFINEGRIFKSDGTEAGTVLVWDSLVPSQGVEEGMANVGGTVFFTGRRPSDDYELWKTDGTPAGTVRVKDIRSGLQGSTPFFLTAVSGKLFFAADDGVHGRELWVSDGTEAGTMMVRDIWPGSTGPFPLDLARSGDVLYFSAEDPTRERQLWKATAGTITPTATDTDGDGFSNAWETAFGLNPNVATGDDGPNGDPDLDGRSNLEEYLDGTHPKLAATLTADKTSLRFGAVGTLNGFSAKTATQSLRLIQHGSGSLSVSVSAEPWLVVFPGTDSRTFSIDVRPDPSLSSTGGTGSVRFTLSGAERPFLEIPVTLDLKAVGSSASPVGLVDTPTNASTGITGALPFTGWAVDDLDVARVMICRAAAGTEIAPVDGNCAGNAQIFVGSPLFIEGARPDVAAVTLAYPRNDRAGWGYLVLTNLLPNQGNGTFTFYVYAQDVEGQSTLLGIRNITSDNAHATRPFGTIDTPAQSGTASGSTFVNFGWALTPSPKSIPTDGSTITVFVDGVSVGTVDYNHFRPDVAAAFPGLANSNGAVGFRVIDTTQLSNGLHTISWTVVDSGGAIEGIGSRFFTVNNAVGSQGTMVAVQAPVVGADASPVRLDPTTMAAVPRDDMPLVARRGWNLDGPWSQFAVGRSGRAVIRGEEVDRFELLVGAGDGAAYTGYVRTGETLAALPVGSRLHPASGSFTWAPGPGFIGAYDLVFVRWTGSRAIARREVRIILAPKGSGHVGVQMVVDTPRTGASVDQPFLLAGWAADLDAPSGSGIDTLHAWAYPLAGGPPVFLGTPTRGGQRPDVAAVHGEQFGESGFGVMVQGLAAGDYDVAVFPWSNVIGAFAPPQVVRVSVR